MIFENATILTINPRREIINHGAVAVSGDRIVAVGKSHGWYLWVADRAGLALKPRRPVV